MAETVPESQTPPAPAPAAEVRTAVAGHTDFSASLESFQGPLDLLLYLIKENEVEITEIPIAVVLDQYLKFLDQAGQWDLQLAGEFLVMAATLMEIKSRELLPVPEQAPEGEEIIEDPRSELVRQLLEYRRLKDQARALEQLQNNWECRRPRGFFGDVPDPVVNDDPEFHRATAKEALLDVDLYTLFASFEKILKSVLAQAPRQVAYEGESIEQKISRIETLLKTRPFAKFAELINDPGSRADIAATFVALLELVRRRAVKLAQQDHFGNIDVAVQQEGDGEALSTAEAREAEAAEAAALKAKAEQDALAAAEGNQNLPWARKKRAPAKPKFEGILRPEDVEEIDAEEGEIARRIDAILAAADAISERFEQSRDGRVRDDTPDAHIAGAEGVPDAAALAGESVPAETPAPADAAAETVETKHDAAPVADAEGGEQAEAAPEEDAAAKPVDEAAPESSEGELSESNSSGADASGEDTASAPATPDAPEPGP